MTRKKPKTYTTVECMVRDIRRGTHESGVFFLARVIRAVRRERSAEVRRLRRAIQSAAAELRKSAFYEDRVLAGQLEAALAPRGRKS